MRFTYITVKDTLLITTAAAVVTFCMMTSIHLVRVQQRQEWIITYLEANGARIQALTDKIESLQKAN